MSETVNIDGKVWQGSDDLIGDLVPVGNLIVLPGNPRQGDVGALTQSLERFGQQKAIVVNEQGVVLAGNHTYLAALALGWTDIAVTVSQLEGAEQTGFALADNRLSDLASYDNEALVAMLSEAGSLEGTGYDDDDMDYLMRQQAAWEGNMLDPSETSEIVRLLGLDDGDETEVFVGYPKIIVHFTDEEAKAEFVATYPLADRYGSSYWYPAKPPEFPRESIM